MGIGDIEMSSEIFQISGLSFFFNTVMHCDYNNTIPSRGRQLQPSKEMKEQTNQNSAK